MSTREDRYPYLDHEGPGGTAALVEPVVPGGGSLVDRARGRGGPPPAGGPTRIPDDQLTRCVRDAILSGLDQVGLGTHLGYAVRGRPGTHPVAERVRLAVTAPVGEEARAGYRAPNGRVLVLSHIDAEIVAGAAADVNLEVFLNGAPWNPGEYRDQVWEGAPLPNLGNAGRWTIPDYVILSGRRSDGRGRQPRDRPSTDSLRFRLTTTGAAVSLDLRVRGWYE